jgi:hypothetical protein
VEDERIFNNLNFVKTKIQNWLIDNLALCVCMFKQSFNTMHNFHYDEVVGIWQLEKCQYSLMFKSFLVVNCLMPSKPCILFSLSTLWLYCFWLFIGFLNCYCYMWTWNTIFEGLLALCFHDPHWFSDHSLPSSLICFLFLSRTTLIYWPIGDIMLHQAKSFNV